MIDGGIGDTYKNSSNVKGDLFKMIEEIKEKKEKINFSKLPGNSLGENCSLKIYQIINHFNIDVGVHLILYIGKTEQ